MTLLWFFFVVIMLVIIILTVFIVSITIQGKITGGMSKLNSYKELLKKLFGLKNDE